MQKKVNKKMMHAMSNEAIPYSSSVNEMLYNLSHKIDIIIDISEIYL